MAVTGAPLFQLDKPPIWAVTTEPFRPKLMPLELANVTAVRLLEVVPALMLIALSAATDAVMIDPLSPKETPLPLLNVSADDRAKRCSGANDLAQVRVDGRFVSEEWLAPVCAVGVH